jgi:hypothetical protein
MKPGWIQVKVTEEYKSKDLLRFSLLLIFSLPLIYLSFSIPIYLKASYNSLQLEMLGLLFVLQNVFGFFVLIFVAYFEEDQPMVLEQIQKG